ncbi:MAG: carboxypeptidase-like regulatory domain-containing protein [Bacteroidaceae bacterium]|nr:carboxypeptidase-like regulatory domain-containing protein [Bacteroidaceae bacterium]
MRLLRLSTLSIMISMAVNVIAGNNYVISGCVMLRDTIVSPAQFASVFIPGTDIGTITDTHGNYTLHVPESDRAIKDGKANVEYAFIGYTTETRSISLDTREISQDTVIMNFQPIMLPATYITDDGLDPATYILSKVWERADVNRKRMSTYNASINYNVSTHQLNLLAGMFPKSLLGIIKAAVAVSTQYGPVFNYCISNNDLDAAASLERSVIKGKVRDKGVITGSSVRLPDNVQKSIISAFDNHDLFNVLYSHKRDWSRKNSKHCKFTFEGTYQYGDWFVDVLKWEYNGMTATLHIVEDVWGILSVQYNDGGLTIRCESRFVNGDILMPVSLVFDCSDIFGCSAEELLDSYFDGAETDTGEEELKKWEKRMRRILTEHKDDFHPYIVAGFTVQYDI